MRILVPLLVVTGCFGTDSASPPDSSLPTTTVFLTPVQHLTRASMALRGMRPTVADLEAVDADPTQLPAIVDRYLASPEFGATIKDLHNEVLLLRVEQPNLTMPAIGPLTGATFTDSNGALFDEPLRLIEDVVMHDQPYTDIVTSNYTMANATVAGVWGLPHATAPDQWERTNWSDGRGNAGILSTSILYHRWRSTGFNYNRGRADMVSRSLLCHDFLTADIQIDTSIDLSDPVVVANAVVKNPTCAGCHQTLDPLASYFFPFQGQVTVNQITAYPLPFYLPNQINRWQTTNKRAPMFFGEQANGLTGLGQAIAADPRFAQCTATHFASYLTEVAQDKLDRNWIARLQTQFVNAGYSAKQLAKAVVLSDEFRVAADTDPTNAEGVVGYQRARPEQMSRMIAGLTGFSWQTNSIAQVRGMPVGNANLLASDFIGFRVLAGGIDSYFVTRPVFTMNATSSLVARGAAAAAADFVVEHDATSTPRTLFNAAVLKTDEASVRTELVNMHARIYGDLVATTDRSIDETYQLYKDALSAAGGDAKRAWKLTLVGMLSDLRALFY
jgi:hypothetical protein